MKNITIVRIAEKRIKEIDYKISKLSNERLLLNRIIDLNESDYIVETLVREYKQLYQHKQPWQC